MTGHNFVELAKQLAAGSTEAEWRSAGHGGNENYERDILQEVTWHP
jgi:hypothetical protein